MKKIIYLLFTFAVFSLNAQTPYKIKTKNNGSSLLFAYKKGTVFNNNLYFNANSDETPTTTLLKYDGVNRAKTLGLIPLSNSPMVNNISESIVFNNKLYFGAAGQDADGDGAGKGNELWTYDNITTPEFVADIYPGSSGGFPSSSNPKNFVVFDGKLIFSAEGAAVGRELYEYDGTNPPSLIQNIFPGASSSNPNYFIEFQNKLYFSGDFSGNGVELLVYDGNNNPSLVFDINPTGNGSDDANPTYLTIFNNNLFFAAEGDTGGRELWKYDGANNPTLVADLNGSGGSNPQNLIVFDNELYFTADDGTNGRELWKYDGTNFPTLVADINGFGDGFATANLGDKLDFIVLENTLYFSADNGADGFELWKYDGTNSPSMVADINTGLMGSEPDEFTIFKGALYFQVSIFGEYNLYKYHPNETRFLDTPPFGQNWFNASNWNNGIPDNTKEAYLPENVDISVPLNISTKKLTIEDGGKLELKKGVNLAINTDLGIANTATLELESDNDQSATLFVDGDVSGIASYKRLGLNFNFWYLMSSPVLSLGIKDFVDHASNTVRTNIAGDKYAIGSYNDANAIGNKWEYLDKTIVDNGTAGNFIPAKGYAISFSGGGPNFVFKGEVNNNSTSMNLVNGKWNVIGNPFLGFFPANRNTNSALADNSPILDDAFKALYFWSASQNKYVAFSSEITNTKYIHPGQAFFIKVKPSIIVESFEFLKGRTEVQPATSSVSFSKSQTLPTIIIAVENNKFTVNTSIQLNDNATKGLDVGLDIGNFGKNDLDIYTKLADNSSSINFTKQSISEHDELTIPIGLNISNGESINFKFTLQNMDNNEIYFQDILEDKILKIDDNFSYNFSANNNIDGFGRFNLLVGQKSLNTGSSEFDLTKIFTQKKNLFIKNLPDDVKEILVFDLQGKQIRKTQNINKKEISINLTNQSIGIYIISIRTTTNKLNRKIILK